MYYIFETDSHIVAHVNGLRRSFTVDTVNAEVTISMNDAADNRVVLYASNGYYRDGCSYFLYFGSWQCQRPFQEFYVTVSIPTMIDGYIFMSYCLTFDDMIELKAVNCFI